MTTTGALIAWATICGTYLRFRKACEIQEIETVEASRSCLQPGLAWYGLIWSVFLSTFLRLSNRWLTLLALFQGYLAFTRANVYWSIVSDSWGFTIGPYASIGGFLALVLVWLIRIRMKQGRWTWQTRKLERVDLTRGVAPEALPKPTESAAWKRGLSKVVNYL